MPTIASQELMNVDGRPAGYVVRISKLPANWNRPLKYWVVNRTGQTIAAGWSSPENQPYEQFMVPPNTDFHIQNVGDTSLVAEWP